MVEVDWTGQHPLHSVLCGRVCECCGSADAQKEAVPREMAVTWMTHTSLSSSVSVLVGSHSQSVLIVLWGQDSGRVLSRVYTHRFAGVFPSTLITASDASSL